MCRGGRKYAHNQNWFMWRKKAIWIGYNWGKFSVQLRWYVIIAAISILEASDVMKSFICILIVLSATEKSSFNALVYGIYSK